VLMSCVLGFTRMTILPLVIRKQDCFSGKSDFAMENRLFCEMEMIF